MRFGVSEHPFSGTGRAQTSQTLLHVADRLRLKWPKLASLIGSAGVRVPMNRFATPQIQAAWRA
jgi:hypothetical protein